MLLFPPVNLPHWYSNRWPAPLANGRLSISNLVQAVQVDEFESLFIFGCSLITICMSVCLFFYGEGNWLKKFFWAIKHWAAIIKLYRLLFRGFGSDFTFSFYIFKFSVLNQNKFYAQELFAVLWMDITSTFVLFSSVVGWLGKHMIKGESKFRSISIRHDLRLQCVTLTKCVDLEWEIQGIEIVET